ncbi:putative membrane protein [Micromonospora pisi]|uniref:Putative membrane protein n=1 Tax=Micromonospora pisi TaxID=589240 RepID=A0A495JI64_9ACTN|nr:permease prefix domain 1-containing protein [Micromonospora pisi]RKR88597.1 putative membrane protein [Micromonospora pisi]
MIDTYVYRLGRALHGPSRHKSDLLTEVRHSLTDTAEGFRAGGMDPAEAERRAVAEFGPVRQLAREYQSELLAGSLRSLAIRMVVVGVVLAAVGDLMWRGAPWTGPEPPAAYLFLSGTLEWLWHGVDLFALGAYLWLGWQARRGRFPVRLARVTGIGLCVALVLGQLVTIAVYTWSVTLWEAALTWPPMLVGGVVLVAVHGWLGRSAYVHLASGVKG